MPKSPPISSTICNMLLSCGLRMAGFDVKAMQVTHVQRLANGGMVVVLDPVDSPEAKAFAAMTTPERSA